MYVTTLLLHCKYYFVNNIYYSWNWILSFNFNIVLINFFLKSYIIVSMYEHYELLSLGIFLFRENSNTSSRGVRGTSPCKALLQKAGGVRGGSVPPLYYVARCPHGHAYINMYERCYYVTPRIYSVCTCMIYVRAWSNSGCNFPK